MIYDKQAEAVDFAAYGFDAEKIGHGILPNSKEFQETILKAYKEQKQKPKFDFDVFKQDVQKIYAEFRTHLVTGKPSAGLQGKIKALGADIGFLEQALASKQEILKQLETDAGIQKAVEVLKQSLDRPKVLVEWDTTKQIMQRRDINKDLDSAIKTISHGDHSAERGHAINTLRRVLISDINVAKDKLSQSLAEFKRLQGKLESMGKPPKQLTEIIKRPKSVPPMVDVSLSIREILPKQLLEPEEVEVKRVREDSWLFEHNFLSNIFSRLEAGPGHKVVPHLKTDVTEEAQSKVHSFLQSTLRLKDSFSNDVVKTLEHVNVAEHAFSIISEEGFKTYKDFIIKLKAKYSPEEFQRIIGYNEDKELTSGMLEDRNKLGGIFKIFTSHVKSNEGIFEQKWKPVIKKLEEFKAIYNKFALSYHQSKREAWYLEWVRGGSRLFGVKTAGFIDEPYRIAAEDVKEKDIKYPDIVKSYGHVIETIENFKALIKEAGAFLNVNSIADVEVLVQDMYKKDPEAFDKWVTKLGSYTNTALKAINDYYSKTEGFIQNMLQGKITEFVKTKTAYGPLLAYGLRRAAFKLLMAADEFTYSPPTLPKKPEESQEDYKKRIEPRVKFPELPEGGYPNLPKTEHGYKPEHEFPATPLRKTVDPKTGLPDMIDYFQKSFPIETILNQWFKISGRETLDPKKVPVFVEQMKSKAMEFVNRKFESKVLEREKDKAETELDAVVKQLDKISNDIKLTGEIFERAYDKYDEALMQSEQVSAEHKLKLEELTAKRKALQKDFEALEPEVAVKKEKEYHDALHGLQLKMIEILTSGKLTQVKNPHTNSIEDMQDVRDKISDLWMDYNRNIGKKINQMKDLQEKNITISNKINEANKFLDEKPSEKQLDKRFKIFIAYIWSVIDNDWAGRKWKGFQAMHNVDYQDYLDTKKEFEKFSGHPLPSASFTRIMNEEKKNKKFLQDKGKWTKEQNDKFNEAMNSLRGGLVKTPATVKPEITVKEQPGVEKKWEPKTPELVKTAKLIFKLAQKFLPLNTEIETATELSVLA